MKKRFNIKYATLIYNDVYQDNTEIIDTQTNTIMNMGDHPSHAIVRIMDYLNELENRVAALENKSGE